METFKYTLKPGWAPNPVFETACAFCEAAEAEFLRESEKSGFLEIQNWFVVHHLSVISTELFLKSFHVTVSHGPVTSADGPDDETVEHAFGGHVANIKRLPEEVASDLKKYLPAQLYELMISLSKDEITRGRYPYEEDGGKTRFPVGDIGQKIANDWLKLSKELSKYGKSGNTVLGN